MLLLQAGSLIVENLRTYRQPLIVYLPPGAELRGGAWVVIDGQINSTQVSHFFLYAMHQGNSVMLCLHFADGYAIRPRLQMPALVLFADGNAGV